MRRKDIYKYIKKMIKKPFNDDTIYEGITELYEEVPFNHDTMYEGIAELYQEAPFNDDTMYEGIAELYDETVPTIDCFQYQVFQYQVSSFGDDDDDVDIGEYSEEYSSPYNDDSIYEGIKEMYQVDSAYRDFINYIHEHEEYITSVDQLRGTAAWSTVSNWILSRCSLQDLATENLDIEILMDIVVDSLCRPLDILKALGSRQGGWRMYEVEELLKNNLLNCHEARLIENPSPAGAVYKWCMEKGFEVLNEFAGEYFGRCIDGSGNFFNDMPLYMTYMNNLY